MKKDPEADRRTNMRRPARCHVCDYFDCRLSGFDSYRTALCRLSRPYGGLTDYMLDFYPFSQKFPERAVKQLCVTTLYRTMCSLALLPQTVSTVSTDKQAGNDDHADSDDKQTLRCCFCSCR